MYVQKSMRRALWSWCLSATLVVGVTPAFAQQRPRDEGRQQQLGSETETIGLGEGIDINGLRRSSGDNFKSPQAAALFKLRQEALRQRLAGKGGAGKIHQVAKGQYVELALERTDKIFVVLVEYGSKAGTALSTTAGPLHNEIPEPDRTVDNNTIWQADYNKAHYEALYNTKMAHYFKTQSSGRYTLGANVTEWVKVPFNGPRYGANAMGDPAAWTLIADAINTWTRDQLSSGKTLAEVTAYLQQFDQWDRYDYDQDGNFDEPDGYIDHFQIVHSGAGEETGGGTLGADAIWSHRWFAFYNWRTFTGPAFNKYGGLEFGGGWGANPAGATTGSAGAAVGDGQANVMNAYPAASTGIWVGDYTIQPENGGLGVFAHEYGHDLGLPDHYDTNGGSNGVGFWNIMASGSYLGDGIEDIGSSPGHMSAWDKLQLGWLNYEVAMAGRFSSHKLGPAETNTKQAQALAVVLPAAANTFYLYSPAVGSLAYGPAFWGGKADLLDTTMTAKVVVPSSPSPTYLTMRLNYQIEANWDYAYVAVSTNNGATWTNLVGQYQSGSNWLNLTTMTNPNFLNLGNGITGSSSGAWRFSRFNVSAYAGQEILLRLRYKTDEFVNQKGILADQITLGSFVENADNADNWTLNGFKITNGIEPSNADHYYLAEFRQYRDYDKGLETGPYTFGDAARPEWVYHYPYQNGLLVTYWDAGEANDNTSQHPGEGLALPIDAHPEPLRRIDAIPNGPAFNLTWSATVQTSDATFSLEPTNPLSIPYVISYSNALYQFLFNSPSLPGVSEFDDTLSYWHAATPANSVIVPKTGTTIRIVNTSAHDGFMQVQVIPVGR